MAGDALRFDKDPLDFGKALPDGYLQRRDRLLYLARVQRIVEIEAEIEKNDEMIKEEIKKKIDMEE